jgi:CorA-like Mg2+ transporter protein
LRSQTTSPNCTPRARLATPVAWLGLFEPTNEEFSAVAREFGLHELAVEDAVKAHQRPKLERYEDTLFLVLRPARYVDETETVMFGEVEIFVGTQFVITVRHGHAPELGPVRRRLEARSRANGLARELASLVERQPELELAVAPETSIVAFRARPAGCPPDRLEGVNRALPEAVHGRGRAFVTGTVFDGRETLRACILHPDTGSEHLAILVSEVVATARELALAG